MAALLPRAGKVLHPHPGHPVDTCPSLLPEHLAQAALLANHIPDQQPHPLLLASLRQEVPKGLRTQSSNFCRLRWAKPKPPIPSWAGCSPALPCTVLAATGARVQAVLRTADSQIKANESITRAQLLKPGHSLAGNFPTLQVSSPSGFALRRTGGIPSGSHDLLLTTLDPAIHTSGDVFQ